VRISSWQSFSKDNPMLPLRSLIPSFVFSGVFLLAGPMIIHLQAGRALAQEAASPSGSPAGDMRAARQLFAKDCAQCHDANGTGSAARKLFPENPDFTNAAWQAGRSDVQFLVSIIEGKGTGMPASGKKITQEQARGLVAFVRTFAPSKKSPIENTPPSKGSQATESSPTSFAKSFRRLQEQFAEQQRVFDELSNAPLTAAPPEKTKIVEVAGPVDSIDKKAASGTLDKPKFVEPIGPARSGTPGPPAVRELFVKHCGKCHLENGTPNPDARVLFPDTPDFTNASWQARRSDGQFLTSILDGKGKGMPAYREKISEDQARHLTAYVRAFVPAKKNSQEDEEERASSEHPRVDSSLGFFDKLVAWLGKFHRPAVHFPIALLVTAALAELLMMVTGRSSFDAAARYSIWVGAITGVSAAILGWCLGGFRLSDPSWVLMAHRWGGTITTASAVLVLPLCELSRCRPASSLRTWFRIGLFGSAMLAMATGFFGGAATYGLDHYIWRQ
jgi:mono/diheme cytochrome c family protein/uncharacterized membrane protein